MPSPSRSGPTVFLHIGPPKTGTTFIQETLRHGREALRDAGIELPAHNKDAFRAALDLRENLRTGHGLGEASTRTVAAGAWGRLVEATLASDRTTIITSEFFSHADAEQTARALDDFRDADLHVIVTARDPERQLVSAFQQRVKQGRIDTFEVAMRATRTQSALHPAQQLDRLLKSWSRGLEPDHVHVVTVPPSGSDPGLLWNRFAAVVGIDPTAFTPSSSRSNETLGVAETELLRRVNIALDGRVSQKLYGRVVTARYANQILTGATGVVRPAVPASMWPLLDEIADKWVNAVRRGGFCVSGDLADLQPAHRSGTSPGTATAEQIADAAVRATAELLIDLTAHAEPAPMATRSAWSRARAVVGRLLRRGPTSMRDDGQHVRDS